MQQQQKLRKNGDEAWLRGSWAQFLDREDSVAKWAEIRRGDKICSDLVLHLLLVYTTNLSLLFTLGCQSVL